MTDFGALNELLMEKDRAKREESRLRMEFWLAKMNPLKPRLYVNELALAHKDAEERLWQAQVKLMSR